MKKTTLVIFLFCVFLLTGGLAHAQQLDLAFGVSTISSTEPDPITPSLRGGGYPSFSGDFLFWHNVGVGMTVAWRGHQSVDASFQPYRPIFYEFNGVYGPPLGKRVQADLQGGIGFESIRFYQPFFQCNFTGCTNFTSSNHFMGHVGGGVKFYVTNSIFLEPMAHFYFVHNNFEFTSGNARRYGAQIGYSFKNRE